jgi:excisionase family DNA binding protein
MGAAIMTHHARKDEPDLDEALAALVRRGFRREIEDAMVTVLTERLPELVEKLRLPARPANSLPDGSEPAAVGTMSRQEAATYAGCHKRTIERAIKTRQLRATGLRLDRIRRFELDRWMDEMARRRQAGEVAPEGEIDIDATVDKMFDEDKE